MIGASSLVVAVIALRPARLAHSLNERRDRDGRERRDANALGRARFVTLDISFMGAPAAHIENGSPDPISAVEIESVRCVDRPDLHVEPNRNVHGWRSQWETIQPGESKMYPMILVDADGTRADLAGFECANTWHVIARWTDAAGRRWRRTGSSEPERVED